MIPFPAMSSDTEAWYARPVFFVADCERALAFYRQLGFREKWRHEDGGELIALQVDRQDAELILNRNAERAGRGRLFLELYPGQVQKCVDEFAAQGIVAKDGHWGMPIKSVTDPDGNEL